MRPVTRNFLLGMGVVVLLLLALGALPSFLKAGDPYYVVAEPADGNHSVAEGTAVNGSALAEARYPFTTAALTAAENGSTGQSDPYWRGPVGVKGAFTHSPFDELAALRQQYPGATDGERVVVEHNGTFYSLAVRQDL